MTLLQLDLVRKSYGRKRVLDDVTAGFPIGLTLLIGPSGAGKSTLLRLLASAERPSRGTIIWDGTPLPAARTALRRSLGYAPQAVELPDDLSARAFAMHMAALKGLDLVAADRQLGAITDAIGLHSDIDNRIITYSGGMRRRLIFAQALLGAPKLLALDEPTAELDGETARRVGAQVIEQAKSAAVIVTTHLADELAQYATQVLRVDEGRVIPA
ncbi:ATP-binding cassette domain-containing protein [Sphingosinicella rhizophila]|uniref:ATP-binding cassette domain-containing protein n=1 Tax=Sphingosinicella rhizophila TaxID=3050082 RepID=A0ABU3QB35_9SPHN|nr:ATP-binding cassette domain-containing protein [Sphingosinicella sp. GR2756]MDT9600160.1 ATP-binding cassette domain-containing protein [Sphingosinicella sp. GR2756]